MRIAQRHSSIQRCGNERISERVRADVLGDPGPVCDPADDPPGAMAVQPPPVRGQENVSVCPSELGNYVSADRSGLRRCGGREFAGGAGGAAAAAGAAGSCLVHLLGDGTT